MYAGSGAIGKLFVGRLREKSRSREVETPRKENQSWSTNNKARTGGYRHRRGKGHGKK